MTKETDIEGVMESIKRGLGKEYRYNQEVTVGAALDEIWSDLDFKLTVSSTEEHAEKRIDIMHKAIAKLGLEVITDKRVVDYLLSEYLSRATLN